MRHPSDWGHRTDVSHQQSQCLPWASNDSTTFFLLRTFHILRPLSLSRESSYVGDTSPCIACIMWNCTTHASHHWYHLVAESLINPKSAISTSPTSWANMNSPGIVYTSTDLLEGFENSTMHGRNHAMKSANRAGWAQTSWLFDMSNTTRHLSSTNKIVMQELCCNDYTATESPSTSVGGKLLPFARRWSRDTKPAPETSPSQKGEWNFQTTTSEGVRETVFF